MGGLALTCERSDQKILLINIVLDMYTQLLGHRPLVSCEIFCKLDTLLDNSGERTKKEFVTVDEKPNLFIIFCIQAGMTCFSLRFWEML